MPWDQAWNCCDMQMSHMKEDAKAFHQTGVKGERRRNKAAGVATGLKTWWRLLANSRWVMVQGRWW